MPAARPFARPADLVPALAGWDGGCMGSPSLFPFNRRDLPSDVVIVQINPIRRPGTPRSSAEILNGINEITVSASLLKELRAIACVSRLLGEARSTPPATAGSTSMSATTGGAGLQARCSGFS